MYARAVSYHSEVAYEQIKSEAHLQYIILWLGLRLGDFLLHVIPLMPLCHLGIVVTEFDPDRILGSDRVLNTMTVANVDSWQAIISAVATVILLIFNVPLSS